MMTVGFVTPFNPFHDKKAWSGTIYKMRESVQNAGYNVEWISINPSIITQFIITPILRCVIGKWWVFTDKKQKLLAKSIRIEELMNCDYLFFPGGAQLLEFLKLKYANLPPTIYCTDSGFHQMIDYYWFDIPKSIQNDGNRLERKAIENSSLIILSSEWSRECVVKYYRCNPAKTEVLEFGANIDNKDIIPIDPYIGKGILYVLFSGVNWGRKGGDIAIDTVKKLNQDGFKSKLFLVGVDKKNIPAEYRNRDYVEYVGFLGKNNPEEYKQYIEILRKCHCLILPTHAECSSIVLCEAAAFGLPAFTYDTGGLANYVINGKTGYRLNTNSKADDYAKVIERTIYNNEMGTLHKGALSYYQERISWSAWSKRFAEVIVKHFGEDGETKETEG